MKLVECTRCGSKELIETDRLVTCAYCQSKFVPLASDLPGRDTVIGLDSDIQELLQEMQE